MKRDINTPKAFISYAWDDPDCDWSKLLEFINLLRQYGVHATCDRIILSEQNGRLSEMMNSAIADNDFIIPILSPKYNERASAVGSGIAYEVELMSAIQTSGDGGKILPVAVQDYDYRHAPMALRSLNTHGGALDGDEPFLNLVRHLHSEGIYGLDQVADRPIFNGNDVTPHPESQASASTQVLPVLEDEKLVNLEQVAVINEYRKLSPKYLFELCGFDFINHSLPKTGQSVLVVYPIVLRSRLNFIHLSHIETFRTLALFYQVDIQPIIIESGTFDAQAMRRFEESWRKVVAKVVPAANLRNTVNVEDILGYIFNPKVSRVLPYEESILDEHFMNEVLDTAKALGESLSLKEFIAISMKEVRGTVKANRLRSKLRKNTYTIWTMAVASAFVSQAPNHISFVLAGADETLQWESCARVVINDKFGALLAPILEAKGKGKNLTHSQVANMSQNNLVVAFDDDFILKWFYQMFVLLAPQCRVSSEIAKFRISFAKRIETSACISEHNFEEKASFAKALFELKTTRFSSVY